VHQFPLDLQRDDKEEKSHEAVGRPLAGGLLDVEDPDVEDEHVRPEIFV